MSALEVHPVADLFPMLAEDELAELAADIKERGQLQPIVLDTDGRIIDGRNRLAACQLASVEPKFSTYDGDDPGGYALAVNIQRRNLTKGQQAMVLARSGIEYRNDTEAPVSKQRVSHARVVVQHAPDLADAVVAGAMGLDEAYRIARENKTKGESAEAQLAKLRAEDPELADKVVEGELTLPGAWAERKARAEEEQRRRRVATHLLCENLVSLAQANGFDLGQRYDPAEALPGRAVTSRTIADAQTALDELAATWKERELP
jgi:ParB-like chromosome segregation protein Spo0J